MKNLTNAFEDFSNSDEILDELNSQLDRIQQARCKHQDEMANTILEAVKRLDNPPIHQYINKLLDDDESSTPEGITHLPPRIQAAILASKRRNAKRDRFCERAIAIMFLVVLFGVASGIPSIVESVQADIKSWLSD